MLTYLEKPCAQTSEDAENKMVLHKNPHKGKPLYHFVHSRHRKTAHFRP